MRWSSTVTMLALLGLSSGAAWAQSGTGAPPPPTSTDQGAPPASGSASGGDEQTLRHMTMSQRFDKANTTHDGHLTLDQAKAGFPFIARNFDKFDTDHKGYVTKEDIHTYYENRKKAREAEPGKSG